MCFSLLSDAISAAVYVLGHSYYTQEGVKAHKQYMNHQLRNMETPLIKTSEGYVDPIEMTSQFSRPCFCQLQQEIVSKASFTRY